ncbi:hypothetical protein PHMEG_00028752 [Phytophthora megakarya]|uniref:Uncharacterized protein n=1 Tax=Phytophthora megakarya TaxID=4795 RepID=A0A225V3R6_9STRA|nr:hypothetical protein PHMEG_00028752 [Phytophthora megakarya]
MSGLAISARVENIIFFHGESRDNPGPGGTGTVILRAVATIYPCWIASMSYGRA